MKDLAFNGRCPGRELKPVSSEHDAAMLLLLSVKCPSYITSNES
jgi:hypothetical protein